MYPLGNLIINSILTLIFFPMFEKCCLSHSMEWMKESFSLLANSGNLESPLRTGICVVFLTGKFKISLYSDYFAQALKYSEGISGI